jgi:putative FmdB family regulatory protein
MPTYDYRCTACGHVFELFHSIKDDSVKFCPECGAPAERVPSGGAGLLFKGSGFYITDYRSKSYKEKAKQEGGGSKSESGGSKSESGGSKSESGGSKSDSGGGSKSEPKPPSKSGD